MTQTNRFPFTKTRLEALPVPVGSRVYYRDAKTEGLTICVTPTDCRTFYVYKWANGRPVRIPLGRFPTMSIEQARKQAQVIVGEVGKGNDPQAARQAARHEQTIKGLFDFWLDSHAKLRNKGWPEDERRFNRYLKPWASRKLSSIKKPDVQSLFSRVARDNGPYAANRLLALIRAMFNKAPDMGYVGTNPTAGVKKFPEEKRDRFLQGDELPAFFRSLLEEPNAMLRDFFLLALLTGARRANVQSMAWVDLDLTARYWRIPTTKSGLPVVVPLVPAAVAILEGRRHGTNGSEWVFPGCGKTGHLVEPKSAWKRIIERAGLVDVRPHDLRRSLGSWQAMGGASLPIIGKSLGHTQVSTTAIYARLQMDPVRDSVESATTAMLAAGNLTIDAGGVKLLEVEPENGGDGDEQ